MYEIYLSIVVFLLGAFAMFTFISIIASLKEDKTNKVRFYVARDKDGSLWLYIGKPFRCNNSFSASLNSLFTFPHYTFHRFGLNKEDYNNLKWEDDPVEVFLNMED